MVSQATPVVGRRFGRRPAAAALWLAFVTLAVLSSACGDVNAALERLSDARRLSADLHVQFIKAAGATDRAVMADTDEASIGVRARGGRGHAGRAA